MTEKKHCNNCKFSYYKREEKSLLHPGGVKRQHCSNAKYLSATHEMLMEDRSGDHCRFWAPQKQQREIKERTEKYNEKHIFHR